MFLKTWLQHRRRTSHQRQHRQQQQQQQRQEQQQNEETTAPPSPRNLSAALSTSPSSFAVVTPASCLHDLCLKIRSNQVDELQLNWLESQFILHVRNLRVLEKALQNANSNNKNINRNTSSFKQIQSISLGWRHANRELLVSTIKCLGRHCKQLKRIRLILNDWIPEHVLRNLLHQQVGLQYVELRSIQVVRKKTTLGRYDATALFTKNDQDALYLQAPQLATNDVLISRIVVPHCLLLSSHQSLQELHLADCGLTDKGAVLLADAIHVRGGLSVLSVRLNKRLTPHGIKVLIQAPVMTTLDLSLCDMGEEIGSGLGMAVAARPWPLTELLLSGNYRIGTAALESLFTEQCCSKLLGLNLSYCDLGEHRTSLVLESLAQLQQQKQHHHQPTLLQKLIMQGCRIAHHDCIESLTKMIRANVPIRILHLNDPATPKIVSGQQLQLIRQAMHHNYELEDISLDFYRTELLEWKEVAFYLNLNRAGRRILLNPKEENPKKRTYHCRPTDWFDVVSKAQHDFDVLYWIVRESAEHFAQWDQLHELQII